ncbi:UNVERIFIED_CONTAM: hypothetical protein Sradi_3327400, partial [Sesamum radiatum]
RCSFVYFRTQNNGRLIGVAVARQAPKVSHLLFADDTLVLCKASMEEISEVGRIFKALSRASGQEINFQKSSMVVSDGVPWPVLFRSIRDRMWDRIGGWNTKLLSQAGKSVLVKTVLQSLAAYAMSCFQLPTRFLWSLEASMANFWWHCRGEKRVHWVAWRKLYQLGVNGSWLSRATGV